MKKRILAIFLIAVFFLTACGTDAVVSDDLSNISSVTASSDEDSSTLVESSDTITSSEESTAEYFLNQVPLDQYTIVYAEDEYSYAKEVARLLKAQLKEITGVNVKLAEDTKEESEYEIIIGDTKREANLKSETLDDFTYAYVTEGKKVVLNAGELYTLELAAERLLYLFSMEKNLAVSKEPTKKQVEFTEPKNVILLIGDGMGENHIKYCVETGKSLWVADLMPNKGLSTTSSYTGTTDSAAAATALSTGYKTYNGRVGINWKGEEVKVMGELAKEVGKSLMIVSNHNIYDATPAGFTAHATDRELTTTIQEQQAQLGALVLQGIPDNTLQGFVNTLNTYEAQEEKNGFFFMNEEGYCDSGGHENDFPFIEGAITRLDALVRYAISYTLHHPDTVLIVTADHETGGLMKDEATGEWKFTSTNHTGVNVPVYAMGYGTETFNNKTVDNTDISKFIAHLLGDSNWGDKSIQPKITFPELSR